MLCIPEARERKPLDVAIHIQKLVARIQSENDPSRLEKLKRDLKMAVHRQRVLEEHKVVKSKNPKTFYKHVSKRLNVMDHLSLLVKEDGTTVTDNVGKGRCYALTLRPPTRLRRRLRRVHTNSFDMYMSG